MKLRKSVTRLGLVGVGGFGQMHLQMIRRLEQQGEVKLLAVCDPNLREIPGSAEVFEASGVRHYDDYREMLQHEPDLDAVTLATPVPFHFDMVRACIKRGLFVYLEKPPVPLYGQLQELIASDPNCLVSVGFQMVESAWSRKIKNWIQTGVLGDVVEVRAGACWPRADIYYRRAKWAGRMIHNGTPVFDGPATNALSHLIHSVMFFGADSTTRFDRPTEIQGEIYRARRIEGYDTACLRGVLTSGASFFAAMTHATEEFLPYQMEVIGTKGWARVSQDGKFLESTQGTFEFHENLDEKLQNSFAVFLRYAKGESSRASTLLKDAEGFLLATNGLLLSSGKVHDISPAWVHRNDDDEIYSVQGLHGAIRDSIRYPCLFSETGLPWAVETTVVSTEGFGDTQSAAVEKLIHRVAAGFDPSGEAAGAELVDRQP